MAGRLKMRACALGIQYRRGYRLAKVKTLFVLPSVDGGKAEGRTRTGQDISIHSLD
jgi:hypothetical protein